MSRYPQYTLSCPIAEDGDKTIPPAGVEEAGHGRLSQKEGWGKQNAQPIAEGGVPPKREDFNGAFFLLSQILMWYQQGGIMEYVASVDYEPGNEIFHHGTKYRCLKANGPEAGVVVPGSDKKTWKNLDSPSVIAGQITPFYNCRLGGSDGRRLIPWGETEADERYVICDGGDDGLGGKVPNLIGKFILPCIESEIGQIGGSLTASTDAKRISGTVGETVLSIDQIPSHSHNGTIGTAGGHSHTVTVQSGGSHGHSGEASSAGSHTHSGSTSSAGSHSHSRGSMNITGKFGCDDRATNVQGGAFYSEQQWAANTSAEGGDSKYFQFLFDASRSWTGSTSSDGSHSHSMSLNSAGSHTHTVTITTGGSHSHGATITTNGSHDHAVTIASSGGGKGHTHTLTGASHTHSINLDLPPFYKMAFFVKLPE